MPDDVTVSIEIPIRASTSLNSRLHWAERARRVKNERNLVRLWMAQYPMGEVIRGCDWAAGRWLVTLTRCGPRPMDSDNVVGALKGVRDSVAEVLGLDDGDARLTWRYRQEKGAYAVRVTIEPAS